MPAWSEGKTLNYAVKNKAWGTNQNFMIITRLNKPITKQTRKKQAERSFHQP